MFLLLRVMFAWSCLGPSVFSFVVANVHIVVFIVYVVVVLHDHPVWETVFSVVVFYVCDRRRTTLIGMHVLLLALFVPCVVVFVFVIIVLIKIVSVIGAFPGCNV